MTREFPVADTQQRQEWVEAPSKPGLWEFRHPDHPGWSYHYNVDAQGNWVWRGTFPPPPGSYCAPPRDFRGGQWRCLGDVPKDKICA